MKLLVASALLLALALPTSAFRSILPAAIRPSTSLYIIGGAIRKMRENDAKKKMPMALPEESENEAPGLRVGARAWKWPPVYPYDRELFRRSDEEEIPPNPLAMATGEIQEDNQEQRAVESASKAKTFWETEEPETVLKADCVVNLEKHLKFYLKDGMDVLEFGASSNSYTSEIKFNSHVGIAPTNKYMSSNPSLTETINLDLNACTDDIGVDDFPETLYNKYDVVLISNTVDFLTSPKEVFKSAYRALKPGGMLMVPFSDRDMYKDVFEGQMTKMWRTMTDDQHMWVVGSFFEFSAGKGWDGLKGFDISPPKPENFIQEKLSNAGGIYVVQATKKEVTEIEEGKEEEGFESMLWLTPTLESRDKMLITPRLTRMYTSLPSSRSTILRNINLLPSVYSALVKMDSFAFPFNLQAQLAANLISEHGFTASEPQIEALEEGLGLQTPGETWTTVGTETAMLDPEEKVDLLTFIVPKFGVVSDTKMSDFAQGIKPTKEVLMEKGLLEADACLVVVSCWLVIF